jgi:microcystin-dependent protein
MYGGNGVNNFAVPDLRGAAPVAFGTPAAGGNAWEQGERTQ